MEILYSLLLRKDLNFGYVPTIFYTTQFFFGLLAQFFFGLLALFIDIVIHKVRNLYKGFKNKIEYHIWTSELKTNVESHLAL